MATPGNPGPPSQKPSRHACLNNDDDDDYIEDGSQYIIFIMTQSLFQLLYISSFKRISIIR
jgi:hypothetical protein